MLRRCLLGVAVLALAGCTGTAPREQPSASPASSAPPSTAAVTCPTPSTSTTTNPTDFPHPPLVRVRPTAPVDADDQALARQGLAALTTFGGPVATSAFQHYLDATGTYLPLPVDRLLAAEPTMVTDLDRSLVDAARAAVTQAATAAPCTAVPFRSGWHGHDDVADPDWRYTLGRFSVQVSGEVVRTPSGRLRVSYRAAVGDTYDFDPGSTFDRFAQLADDGHAAVFLDGGLTAVHSATVRTATDLAAAAW